MLPQKLSEISSRHKKYNNKQKQKSINLIKQNKKNWKAIQIIKIKKC